MLKELFFQIVPLLAMITILVAIHELGHYWVARACGVAVHSFSVGLGKALWAYQDKKAVTWRIGMIPLGGYVRMASLDLLDYKKEIGEISEKRYQQLKPLTMEGQSTFKRIAIAAAGPFMNIVFAFLLLAGMFLYGTSGAKVTCVVPNSPADEFGLKKGDKLSFTRAQQQIGNVEGAPHLFRSYLHRKGEKQLITIERRMVDFSPCNINAEIKQALLPNSTGILLEPTGIKDFSRGFLGSIKETTSFINTSFTNFIKSFASLLRPASTKKEGDLQVGGIISVQKSLAKISQVSIWYSLFFAARISLALAWFNLLPIPILDGGHILIATIEGVARKRLSPQKRNFITIIGLAFLLFLFILLVKIDLFG